MRKKQRDIEKEKKRAEMAMNEDSMTEQRVHVKEVNRFYLSNRYQITCSQGWNAYLVGKKRIWPHFS